MSVSPVCLSRMVDLALGSPDAGSVNFGVLRDFLHALLHQLNVGHLEAKVDRWKVTCHTSNESQIRVDQDLPISDDAAFTSNDLAINNDDVILASNDVINNTNDDVIHTSSDNNRATEKSDLEKIEERGLEENLPRVSSIPYRGIKDKAEKFELSLMDLSSSLPSNRMIMENIRKMWEMEKGCDAVDKAKPVVDLWHSLLLSTRVDANTIGISKLMSLVEDLMIEIETLRNKNEELQQNFEKICTEEFSKTKELLSKIKDLGEGIARYEERINDMNESLDHCNQVTEGVVTWEALEDALNKLRKQVLDEEEHSENVPEPSPDARMTPSSKGPSPELQARLEQLGVLIERHDALAEQVDRITLELENKADKDYLSLFGRPEDMKNNLDKILNDLESLKSSRSQESNSLKSMQEMLNQFQKENLACKSSNDQFVNEMNGKIDRSEFESFLDELDRRLSSLTEAIRSTRQSQQQQLQQLLQLQSSDSGSSEADAAGFRKQYHCISCDKPLDFSPRRPLPALQVPPRLPDHKPLSRQSWLEPGDRNSTEVSPRIENVTLYATPRPCGGAHTSMHPKLIKSFRDDYSIESIKLRKNNNAKRTKLPKLYAMSSGKQLLRTGREATSKRGSHENSASAYDMSPYSILLTPDPEYNLFGSNAKEKFVFQDDVITVSDNDVMNNDETITARETVVIGLEIEGV